MNRSANDERRRAVLPFEGAERRRKYSGNEMPPDPTPGEPGKEAAIEEGRLDRGDRKRGN
ncbi:MAG TPA: hypothetical protein VFB08_19400 [Burkholderiales bacterium]|nr:hypothetical protein [Burkholderiales bacterium]